MPSFRQSLVANLLRRYPLYSGCGSIANSAMVRRLVGECAESVWATVPGGEVLASLDDYVGRSAFYVGDLDRKVTWICRKVVRPGDVVIDVGANIGMVTVWLSQLVGSSGRVHSFEPNPLLSNRLSAAVERNRLSNVQVHPYALGSVAGEMSLCIPTGNAGAASLVRRTDASRSRTIVVPVQRLSDVAKRLEINSIRFIKIDVEGFEIDVLQGAEELLGDIRPESILFEMNGEISGHVGDEPVMKLLKKHDYAFFMVPRRSIWMRLEAFNPDASTQLKGHDVLAVAKGPNFGLITRAVGAAE